MWIAADAPNVADWISAIGQATGSLFTAVAVGVALWLAVRDRKWRRADAETAKAERKQLAVAQARLVSSSLRDPQIMASGGETAIDAETTFHAMRPNGMTRQVEARHLVWVSITNGGAGPIFVPRVHEIVIPNLGAMHPMRVFALPSDAIPRAHPDVLPSGESTVIPVSCVGPDGELIEDWSFAHATISFADALGYRWRREGAGGTVLDKIQTGTAAR